MAKRSDRKNHEYIRYILPKGRSFEKLTEDNVNKIKSHINSVSRDSLEEKTPNNVIEPIISREILLKLGIEKINADDVNLSPKLLKGGDK